MPTAPKSSDKKKSARDTVLDISRAIPVPAPGSAGGLIESVRKKIIEALRQSDKKKKK